MAENGERQITAALPVKGGSRPLLPEALSPQTGFPAGVAGTVAWKFRALADHILALVRREMELETAFCLAPVFLGAGILTYFAAPSEPWFPAILAGLLAITAITLGIRVRTTGYHVAAALAFFLLGMAAAQMRTMTSDRPVISGQITAQIQGMVIASDAIAKGRVRYLIKPHSIETLTAQELPFRIRLSTGSKEMRFKPGDLIAGKARLAPFSGPANPGGFDFGFFNWFDGLGGTGYFLGKPQRLVGGAREASLGERFAIATNHIRLGVAERIVQQLPGESGAIAVALIIGDRSGISAPVQDSLRLSGLAHILAISGLHMALVTLGTIVVLRTAFSLLPRLALSHPTRKWAAGGGLAVSTVYLILSGSATSTQRSWIMLSIMLAAVLIDRRAITIRNVTLAALIVLLFTPESLLEPGFQMSFAAAGALVAAYSALYEWNRRRLTERPSRSVLGRSLNYFSRQFGALAFTSLVAGLATALFSAWHFHRVAPLGLVANLFAMPMVSIAVMPLALASTLAMPFGLETLPLRLLGQSIDRVVAVSDWVNQFPAPAETGVQPLPVMVLGATGLLLLILLKTRLRLIGLLPLAAMFVFAGKERAPDFVISQDGRAAALRAKDGSLAVLYPRRNRFVTDIWLRAWSGSRSGNREGVVGDCDSDRCIATSPSQVRMELVYNPKLLRTACKTADILVAPRLWWVRCPAPAVEAGGNGDEAGPSIILKRLDFERFGTHAIYLEERSPAQASDTKRYPSTWFNRERQSNQFPIVTRNGAELTVRIEKALSDAARPWNAARNRLSEPGPQFGRSVHENESNPPTGETGDE